MFRRVIRCYDLIAMILTFRGDPPRVHSAWHPRRCIPRVHPSWRGREDTPVRSKEAHVYFQTGRCDRAGGHSSSIIADFVTGLRTGHPSAVGCRNQGRLDHLLSSIWHCVIARDRSIRFLCVGTQKCDRFVFTGCEAVFWKFGSMGDLYSYLGACVCVYVCLGVLRVSCVCLEIFRDVLGDKFFRRILHLLTFIRENREYRLNEWSFSQNDIHH